MASRPAGENNRGPKIGDAASLWNITPSPGWTKPEAQILKLCLYKFGIGRWVQILDTGLLPGKLIQQLNGQTQRLLGQQSLAAYTGLQVDIDRIRADNEARTDAPRKAGLIINTGPNLTKEVKEKMQEEARANYGLTKEQIKEASDQVDELIAEAQATAGATAEDAALLSADPTTLSKDDKVSVLKALRSRLEKLQSTLTQHEQRVAAAKNTAGETSNSDQENDNDAVNAVAPSLTAAAFAASAAKGGGNARQPKRKSAGSDAPAKGKGTRPGRGKKSSSDDSDEEMEDAAEAKAAMGAAAAADVALLVGMGFGERQAKDALEEANGSVDVAADWLMTNCM